MKIKINIAIFLFFFYIISISISAEEYWPCQCGCNGGRDNCISAKELPLEEFQQNIIPCGCGYDRELFIQNYSPSITNYAGQLHGKKLYDIIHEAKNAELKYYYKMIVMEGINGKYNPVFCTFDNKENLMPAKSYIISNKDILVNEAQFGGNGVYLDRFYLYFPSSFFAPKIIDTNSIYSAIKKIFPKGYNSGPREIFFDIETLKVSFYVYANNDSSCCPTGGKFDAQFIMTDAGDLKLLSYKYDPEDLIK